jgi:hypothetical protein
MYICIYANIWYTYVIYFYSFLACWAPWLIPQQFGYC